MLRVTKNKINFPQIFENFLKEEEKDDYMSRQMVYDSLFGTDEDWWNDYETEKSKKKKKGRDNDQNLIWCKDFGEFITKEEYDFYMEEKEHTKRKRGGNRGRSKKRKFVEYDDDFFNKSSKEDETLNNDTNYSLNKKRWIYFYPDFTDKTNKIEFETLFELDGFLETNCIHTTEADVKFLLKNTTIHCASIKKTDGQKMLVVDNSWGNLIFSVQEMQSVVSGVVKSKN